MEIQRCKTRFLQPFDNIGQTDRLRNHPDIARVTVPNIHHPVRYIGAVNPIKKTLPDPSVMTGSTSSWPCFLLRALVES